jgi:hypothetical protein
MPSGGHARSGPPRDPNALRRGGAADPAEIRLSAPTNPPPAWPLPDEPTEREAHIWNGLWIKPQATAWRRFDLIREVAVYTRCLAEFEAPGKKNANLGNFIRKMADDLGLTLVGFDRNKWRYPAADRPAAPVTLIRRPSARDRFARAPAPADSDPPPI